MRICSERFSASGVKEKIPYRKNLHRIYSFPASDSIWFLYNKKYTLFLQEASRADMSDSDDKRENYEDKRKDQRNIQCFRHSI